MRKTFITLTSAAALALAGALVPVRAEANPLALWVIPTIIAAGAGGVATGALATNANDRPVVNETTVVEPDTTAVVEPDTTAVVEPDTTAVVEPDTTLASNCSFERMRIHGIWRRVEVCE